MKTDCALTATGLLLISIASLASASETNRVGYPSIFQCPLTNLLTVSEQQMIAQSAERWRDLAWEKVLKSNPKQSKSGSSHILTLEPTNGASEEIIYNGYVPTSMRSTNRAGGGCMVNFFPWGVRDFSSFRGTNSYLDLNFMARFNANWQPVHFGRRVVSNGVSIFRFYEWDDKGRVLPVVEYDLGKTQLFQIDTRRVSTNAVSR